MVSFAFKIKGCLPSFLGGRKRETYEAHRGYTGNTYKSEYDSFNTFIVKRDPSIRSQEGGDQFVPFLNSTLGSNNNNNNEGWDHRKEWGSGTQWRRFLSGRSFGSEVSQHPSELRKARDDKFWEDSGGEFWFDASGNERKGGGVFPQK